MNLKLTFQAILTIGYMALAHYTSWLLDALIHQQQLRELAALTIGVTCTYLPVDAITATLLDSLGATPAEKNRARVALLGGYFTANIMAGIGVVFGRAFDRRINGKEFGIKSIDDVLQMVKW